MTSVGKGSKIDLSTFKKLGKDGAIVFNLIATLRKTHQVLNMLQLTNIIWDS